MALRRIPSIGARFVSLRYLARRIMSGRRPQIAGGVAPYDGSLVGQLLAVSGKKNHQGATTNIREQDEAAYYKRKMEFLNAKLDRLGAEYRRENKAHKKLLKTLQRLPAETKNAMHKEKLPLKRFVRQRRVSPRRVWEFKTDCMAKILEMQLPAESTSRMIDCVSKQKPKALKMSDQETREAGDLVEHDTCLDHYNVSDEDLIGSGLSSGTDDSDGEGYWGIAGPPPRRVIDTDEQMYSSCSDEERTEL